MKQISFAVVLLFVLSVPFIAQTGTNETNWRIQALDDFHIPIYTLWHDAWPAKDVAKLKELVPAIEKAYAELAKAQLPGILREKKPLWDAKLKELEGYVKEYGTAAKGEQTQPILNAAEKVHAAYEGMVRVVRPVLKEIDAFHQALYTVHHYEMPAEDIAKLAVSADTLAARMVALNGTTLSERLMKKNDQFQKARKSLGESVTTFAAAVKAKKPIAEIKALESAMHARYQVVEKVFE
jgi:hypothetical protein